jgi:coproporphyrinogen III oxidase-like Fe-S oxidoreductase
VQSFQEKQLAFLGRNYRANAIRPALDLLKKTAFNVVNIDLMFALTGQTVDDVLFDLQQAIDAGVDQITTYSLFTFPYSAIGKFMALKNSRCRRYMRAERCIKRFMIFCSVKGLNGYRSGDLKREPCLAILL